MRRDNAEAIYNSGKEPTIKTLMDLDDENESLRKKIASLTQNSTNSSKPPSSDGPEVVRANKKRSQLKPGGQPGHKGHRRTLLPSEEMNQIEELYPNQCERCGEELSRSSEKRGPLRYQWFELPKIEMTKIEYRTHSLKCRCGHTTRATLPEEVRQSQFGPNLHSTAAYLTTHRVSRRGIAEIIRTVFHQGISLGAIEGMLKRMNTGMAPVVEEIEKKLPKANSLNIDETGWKTKGKKRWLWVFANPVFEFFKILPSRGSKVLESLLGKSFNGIISSDDFSAYHKYIGNGIWQLCWAHLIRKLEGLKENNPESESFADMILKEADYLFSYWHFYKEETIDRNMFCEREMEIKSEIKQICGTYTSALDKSVQKRAKKILKQLDRLFTFVLYEGIEPTNNTAERSLRPAVQWRKICFGNQSESGERFTERILTLNRTCKIQKKNPLYLLSEIMHCVFRNTPLPSLV